MVSMRNRNVIHQPLEVTAMQNEIQEILDNWRSTPTIEVSKQQFSIRLSAPLAAKIITLSEMFKRNRAEIMHDLLEYAVAQVSANMTRERVTKAQLWEREWTTQGENCPPRDVFDEVYPGPDSTVYSLGHGWRFDSLWRQNLQNLAGLQRRQNLQNSAGQPVEPVEEPVEQEQQDEQQDDYIKPERNQ